MSKSGESSRSSSNASQKNNPEKSVEQQPSNESTGQQDAIQTDALNEGLKTKAVPFHALQFPLDKGPQGGWKKRPRSPGLKWYRKYDSLESLKHGRVLVIDYIKQDHSKQGMRKVAAQEISSVEGLRKMYSNPERCGAAILRVMHCQNAGWAVPFLLHKFNITAKDDLVGTDFGKYVKYVRPERRGNKPFLSGKSWQTVHDPWRGISRTSFGLDYMKQYECPRSSIKAACKKDKMFELNYYNDDDQPEYGWDVYVQRLSCYIQHREPTLDVPNFLESPYNEAKSERDPHRYVPDLESLDNGNTIIIFENSQTGSIEDTAIAARQQWESRWRRLPFYLAYESHDVSNDDVLSLECMKIILQDVWKAIAENWEDFLDVCNTHVSILEEKIYEQPADESRAPELWTNSSMWLKVERLVAIHDAVLKEMQQNLKEFISEGELEDNWLEAIPADMEKIKDLTEENLTKPTANLADLMYKSVGIRDSRHSLQLNTSMWRLSWITFIFLPLTFISSFFGMNVDIFQSDPGYPSIRYYFASAVPMMFITLILWYIVKHFLASRRQTPYQRGIYEHFFFQLASAYPGLWSRTGPNENLAPGSAMDRLKWRLVTFWNDPAKTVRAGAADADEEYDDLGAWSRFKRSLTRRWTSQIRVSEKDVDDPTVTTTTSALEEGKVSNDDTSDHIEIRTPVQAAQFMRTAATGDLPGGMLEIPGSPVAESTFMRKQTIVSPRPSSAGSSGANRSSGIMVEEEPNTWLRDYGVRLNDVNLY
ncbi:hypothetical protein ACLMJK_000372 [Lecanora helva]